jgi:ketosteroid isomerase-like protein
VSDSGESDNVRAMRRGYEAVMNGDFDAIQELLSPEVEMHDRAESPDPGTYSGPDGARSAMNATYDYFDDVELVPERFHEGDDCIVVEVVLRGRGKGSGVPVEEHLAHLWRLRDDQPYYMQAYTRVEDALRDAGIVRR